MKTEDYIKKLGENIKKARLQKNMQQKELAYQSGFDKQNLYRIESGKTNPTIKTLLKIAIVLDIALADLLPKEKASK